MSEQKYEPLEDEVYQPVVAPRATVVARDHSADAKARPHVKVLAHKEVAFYGSGAVGASVLLEVGASILIFSISVISLNLLPSTGGIVGVGIGGLGIIAGSFGIAALVRVKTRGRGPRMNAYFFLSVLASVGMVGLGAVCSYYAYYQMRMDEDIRHSPRIRISVGLHVVLAFLAALHWVSTMSSLIWICYNWSSVPIPDLDREKGICQEKSPPVPTPD